MKRGCPAVSADITYREHAQQPCAHTVFETAAARLIVHHLETLCMPSYFSFSSEVTDSNFAVMDTIGAPCAVQRACFELIQRLATNL
jgi:hypothetical protein